MLWLGDHYPTLATPIKELDGICPVATHCYGSSVRLLTITGMSTKLYHCSKGEQHSRIHTPREDTKNSLNLMHILYIKTYVKSKTKQSLKQSPPYLKLNH